MEKAQNYFEEHGSKTIVLARFVPIVRTFAPIVAGVGRMEYRTFVSFNVLGGLLWAVGVTSLGYILGETVPSIDKYLLPVIGVIVAALRPPGPVGDPQGPQGVHRRPRPDASRSWATTSRSSPKGEPPPSTGDEGLSVHE